MKALKMEIQIKAHVECSDGPAGDVTHLVVHPGTRTLVGIVVKEEQPPHVERLVPFRAIEDASGDQVRLGNSCQELAQMQAFFRTESVETTAWWHGRGPAEFEPIRRENIADDEVALDADTPVKAIDGVAGRVVALTMDPARSSITRLTLRESGVLAARLVTLLISEVESIDSNGVTLRIDRARIEALRPTSPRKRQA